MPLTVAMAKEIEAMHPSKTKDQPKEFEEAFMKRMLQHNESEDEELSSGQQTADSRWKRLKEMVEQGAFREIKKRKIDNVEAEVAEQLTEAEAAVSACPEPIQMPKRNGKNRKGKERGKTRKARKTLKNQHAGYIPEPKIEFRRKGGKVSKDGNVRTCLPDSAQDLLAEMGVVVHDEQNVTMRNFLHREDENGEELDSLFEDLNSYTEKNFGISLKRVTSDYDKKKGGLAFNILQETSGYFIIQVLINNRNSVTKTERHCLAYNGKSVRDSDRRSKIRIIENSDRECPQEARKVFEAWFNKENTARIVNVYKFIVQV